jgi:hypothetical protein
MNSLKILGFLIKFSVISFIGLKSLNGPCFNAVDIDLSLAALIFTVIIELVIIARER